MNDNTKPIPTSLVTVLNDGDTFTSTEGTKIAAVPDDVEDVETFLKEGDYDSLPLGEVKDSDTILRFFRLFFPEMQVDTDNDGQVIIYTGINEN
jgi:hypothetical protein